MIKSKIGYLALSIFTVIGLVLLTMKILSMRTYDPENPKSKPNSYLLSESLLVNLAVDTVFDFLTYSYDQNVYQQIAQGHQVFQYLTTKAMTPGSVILCKEFAEEEGTVHRYVVEQVIENRLIMLASEPSKVYMRDNSGKINEVTHCNCYVYLEMEPAGARQTTLTWTLVIQMPNFIIKFITDVLGGQEGKARWQNHLHEELTGLARVMLASKGQKCKSDSPFSAPVD